MAVELMVNLMILRTFRVSPQVGFSGTEDGDELSIDAQISYVPVL